MITKLLDRIIHKNYEEFNETNYQVKPPLNRNSITLLILLIIQVIGSIYLLFLIGINNGLIFYSFFDPLFLILSIIGILQKKKLAYLICIIYTFNGIILSFIILISFQNVFNPFYSLLFFCSYTLDVFTLYCGLKEYNKLQEFYPSEKKIYQFCPKCGILLVENQFFCANCGIKLNLDLFL